MDTARTKNSPTALSKLIERRTARKRETIWREHREPYKLLTENSLDVITVLAADAGVEYATPSIRKVLGYKPEEIVGKNLLEWVHPDDIDHMRICMAHQIQIPGPAPVLEFRFRHKDGSWRFLEAMPNNLIFKSGVHGIVMTSRDISDRKRMEQELRKAYNEMSVLTRELEKLNADLRKSNELLAEISKRDPLTGLFNRKAAIEIAGEHFARWRRDGTQFSVQIIDIDNFKSINDTYGHLYGDNGLMFLSRAIMSSVRSTDTASRLGGDEFLVILSGTGLDEAEEVGRKILGELRDDTLELRKNSVHISASIGIAAVTLADQSVDSLLARADKALYRAKRQGKNQVAVSQELAIPA